MIINEFDQEKVEAICSVIADTSDGLSGKELKHMLDKCCVKYQSEVMPNKRTWLFNSLADEFNINHSILVFKNMIEITLNPASYTSFDVLNLVCITHLIDTSFNSNYFIIFISS